MTSRALTAAELTAADYVCEVCGASVWDDDPGDSWVYCRVCGLALDATCIEPCEPSRRRSESAPCSCTPVSRSKEH